MKVLWLCNIMLPFIAKNLGQPIVVKEGWLSGLVEKFIEDGKEKDVELSICFPASDYFRIAKEDDSLFVKGQASGIPYYVFREDTVHPELYDAKLETCFQEILQDCKPDLIHIFGTEYPHTLAMTRACENPSKILIGIQGICSACADVYMADLPEKVQRHRTFRDILKRDSLIEQQEKFYQRAEHEKEALVLAGHVTGRTDFDREWTKKLAPQATYHFMNETLRENFYLSEWNIDRMDRYAIFVSQGNYPLKGLHFVFEALAEIVKAYPETRLYVAGDVITAKKTIKDHIKISEYGKYLLHLISKYHLEKHVEFVGKLSAAQMCARYLKTHVFLNPAIIENSPNSVGEAMLLGVPVVSSDVGGVHNLLQDGEDGILYPYQDKEAMKNAIIRIFEDDKLALSFSSNAKAHAKRTHNAESNYRRLLEIYHEINHRI